MTFLRASIVGVICGIIPGAGATIASFVSYGIEGQYGKRRAQLGTGIAEGIVAPQVASTASVGGHMVPLLTLGIPGSGATAVILGAFLLHGVQPGPQIFQTQSALVYAIFASTFAAVLGMCALGYFAIRPLVKVLYLPEAIVSVFVIMFCLIGAYSEHNNLTDLWMIVVFGVVGYLFEHYRFPDRPDGAGHDPRTGRRDRVPDLDDQLRERLDGLLHATGQRRGHGALRHRAAVSVLRPGQAQARPRGPASMTAKGSPVSAKVAQ